MNSYDDQTIVRKRKTDSVTPMFLSALNRIAYRNKQISPIGCYDTLHVTQRHFSIKQITAGDIPMSLYVHA
jgi:hypothetical protein